MQQIKAQVIKGYQVASGTSETDHRFPGGTIRLQTPYFKECGLDFDEYFKGNYVFGTLNLRIVNKALKIVKPEYYFKQIRWTEVFPPENFYLSKCTIEFRKNHYLGLFYIPDPSTKPDHFNNLSITEVIAQKIPEIKYSDFIHIFYNENEIAFNDI